MTRSALRAALAALPFAASAAIAQDKPAAAAAGYQEVDDGQLVVIELNKTVDELEDMPVMGPDGAQIGEIEEVLADSAGAVVALAVETEGFLGIGSEDVILGLDQVRFIGDQAVVSMTEEELEQLPRWDD